MLGRATTGTRSEGLRELAAHGWAVLTPLGAEPADDVRIDHVLVGPTGAFAPDGAR
ncbi:MAG: hypothetical protein ACXWW7_14990 [Nocardioides sp.]